MSLAPPAEKPMGADSAAGATLYMTDAPTVAFWPMPPPAALADPSQVSDDCLTAIFTELLFDPLTENHSS